MWQPEQPEHAGLAEGTVLWLRQEAGVTAGARSPLGLGSACAEPELMGCPLSPLPKQTGPADNHPASRRSASTPKIQGVRGYLDPQKISLGWASSSPTLGVSDIASDVQQGVGHTGPPQQRYNPHTCPCPQGYTLCWGIWASPEGFDIAAAVTSPAEEED